MKLNQSHFLSYQFPHLHICRQMMTDLRPTQGDSPLGPSQEDRNRFTSYASERKSTRHWILLPSQLTMAVPPRGRKHIALAFKSCTLHVQLRSCFFSVHRNCNDLILCIVLSKSSVCIIFRNHFWGVDLLTPWLKMFYSSF